MADDDDSNALYLIVGGLLVVALIFGFVVYGRYNNPANIEPAAGTPSYSSTVTPGSTTTETTTTNSTSSPSNTPPYTAPDTTTNSTTNSTTTNTNR